LGKSVADRTWQTVKQSVVHIVSDFSDEVFAEAGRLKASYKISLADAIALAETSVSGGVLVTADHHEMDKVEQREPNIKFQWIR
jgi:predicted nucleic acid-binding protein